MDEIDLKIIRMLSEDIRASYSHLARQIGVSEATIRRRLKVILDSEIVNVAVVLDHRSMGYRIEALIGIKIIPSEVDRVRDSVSRLEEVSWTLITTGCFDIFAWSRTHSTEELDIVLSKKIGKIPGVIRSQAFINISKESTSDFHMPPVQMLNTV